MKKIILFALLGLGSYGFSQMTTVGTASQYGGCNCYQIVPPLTNNVAGAIWSPAPIDLSSDFDMTFEIYAGANDIWGADGMAFVLQQNATGIGGIGNAMGFASPMGVPPISSNNLAIEIDVFDNGGSVPTDHANDHIGINSNGVNSHNLVAATPFPGLQEISDGAYHTFRVQWVAGSNLLAVYWQNAVTPMVILNNDIVTNIFAGNSTVYWGFTGATGGLANEMRVCVSSTASYTPDQSTVCPGTTINFTDASSSTTGIINSWSWDFDDGTPADVTQNPSHTYTSPGTYNVTLTMTDGFGCDYTDMQIITILDSLDLTMDSTAVTCFGDTDGTAMATPTNGSSPYSYQWNDTGMQTTQTASGLPPGVYVVNVTDNLGCAGIDSVIIDEPLELLLDMNTLDVLCYSDSTGEASVTTANGVAPFTYQWDDYASQTNDTASTLPAGNYSVVVTDVNGCTATDSVEIFEAPQMNISATATHDNGSSNGTIDLTVSGGTPGYAYSWSTGQGSEDISGLPSGDYTVTVTDANGCESELTVTVPSSVGFESLAAAGFSVYPNPSNGQFQIMGSGNYRIIIEDVRGRTVLEQNANDNMNVSLADVEQGIYILTIVKEQIRFTEKLILK